ncbi:hypothetical protein LQW54_002006 [Pestalotiopsis sp. IQ-011]
MFLSYGMMWPIPSVYRPSGFFRSHLPDEIFLAASREGSQSLMALVLRSGQNQGALPIWDRLVLLDIAIQARCANNALWILRREELKINFSSLGYDTEVFSSSMLYECLNADKPELYPIAVEMLRGLGENVLVEPVVHRPNNCDYWREMLNTFGRSRAEILLGPMFQQAHESPMACYYWNNHQEENVAGVSFARYMQTLQDEFEGEYDSEEAANQSELDDTDQEDSEGAETDGGASDVQDGDE